VGRGDPVGEVGSTGNSTGPHVHFEIRIGGVPQNPLDFLPPEP
jgi:murein DD-endopeptidase MepM/ murein hydrolase activator NlpD